MKMEEKLNEIESLLNDFEDNANLLQEALLNKYDNDVSDEEYLNDIGLLKYWNKDFRKFLGKKYD